MELFRQQLLKHGTYLLKNNRHISKTEFAEALEECETGCSAWDGFGYFSGKFGDLKRWMFGFRLRGFPAEFWKTKKTYAQNFSILRIRRYVFQRCVYIRSSLRTYVMLPAAVTIHTVCSVFASSETSRSSSHYQSQSVARRQPHD